jgi:hypothetical protein
LHGIACFVGGLRHREELQEIPSPNVDGKETKNPPLRPGSNIYQHGAGKTVPDIPGDARKLASTIGNAFDTAGKLSAHAQAQHIHCLRQTLVPVLQQQVALRYFR